MNLGFQLFTTFEAFTYLLHLDYFASRTLTAPRKFLTSHLSWQPYVAVFDDSNMAGRPSEIQIQCKLFFQLSCNCLIIRENNFISSWLAIHGLGG